MKISSWLILMTRAVWLNSSEYSNYNKNDLKNLVHGINSSGGTNIGEGLLTMKNALESTPGTKTQCGIVLLTDGKNSTAFDFNLLDWYTKNNIPVSTISFVGDVDNNLLNDIAALTGGNYFRARTASDVVMYFREFLNSLSGNSSLALFKNKITLGESQSYSFFVEKDMEFIYAGTSWGGSKIRMRLISPSQKLYSENYLDSAWNLGSNYVSCKIENPIPGKWEAQFYGEIIPSEGEDYTFQVMGNSPYKVDLENTQLVNGKMHFEFHDSGPESISNITSRIGVVTPSNRIEDISANFSKNGFNYFPRDGEGNYNFTINLLGEDVSGSKIQRYFTRTVLVGSGAISTIAPVKMMEGNYLYTDLGTDIGNFPGLECTIYSVNGNIKVAKGYVTFVKDSECIIELQSFYSGSKIKVGDTIELNVLQWQQDH